MWCEEDGIFLNKRLSDGSFSKKLSPTLFYPMLAGAATPQQAKRMVEEHLMNPNDFYGDWMIPSIAKNDPTYQQQDYWRGRIWPPMNYLVYLALRCAGQREASALVMQKSLKLLMHTWQENQMVHENYNAISGRGRNKEERMNTSDSYYHWGGLLAFMALTEAGYVPDPCQPLAD
jgi:neutral trehalase